MKIKNIFFKSVLAAAMFVAVGCGSESSLDVTSLLPGSNSTDKSTSKLPYANVTAMGINTTVPVVTGVTKYRCTVVFSAEMDQTTLEQTGNIVVRDIAAAISTVASTVTYIPSAKTAYVDMTLTNTTGGQTETSLLELFISRNVKDTLGNGLAGIQVNTAYKTVNMDYRVIFFAGSNAGLLGEGLSINAGLYNPLYVTGLSISSITTTTASVTLTLSRNVPKSALLTSIFTISGGTVNPDASTLFYDGTVSTSNTNLYAKSISFQLMNLSANTVYTVSVNPATLSIYNPAVAPGSFSAVNNLYPDNTTPIFTETAINFMDLRAFEYQAGKRISDFMTKFVTPSTTATLQVSSTSPSVSGVSPYNFSSLGKTVDVTFSVAVDPSTLIADNFIAYTYSSNDYIKVPVKVTPVYTASGVTVVHVSTAELGNENIYRLKILNSVKSAGNTALDGNEDDALFGTVDITGDNVVDDDNWYSWN